MDSHMAVGIKTMEQNSGSRQNRCRINNQKAGHKEYVGGIYSLCFFEQNDI